MQESLDAIQNPHITDVASRSGTRRVGSNDTVGLWGRIRGKGGSQRGESPAASQHRDEEFEDYREGRDQNMQATEGEGGKCTKEQESQIAALRDKANEFQASQDKAVAAAAKQARENAELVGLNSSLQQQVTDLTKENERLKVSHLRHEEEEEANELNSNRINFCLGRN